jgi:hypothetical protein
MYSFSARKTSFRKALAAKAVFPALFLQTPRISIWLLPAAGKGEGAGVAEKSCPATDIYHFKFGEADVSYGKSRLRPASSVEQITGSVF